MASPVRSVYALKYAALPSATSIRRLDVSLTGMRVMEENRLSSGIRVEMVRHSVEEHLSYLNTQIKRCEELIRHHINNHPTLKQQSQLLDSIPGIAKSTALLLSADHRQHAIQKRASGRRLCWTGPA